MAKAIRAGKFGGVRQLTAAARGATMRRHGAIAQLGERLDRTQEVSGSSPLGSTGPQI